MRIKINFETGNKINVDLPNPVKFIVKSKNNIREFNNPKEAIVCSNSLIRLGIDNSIKLLFN